MEATKQEIMKNFLYANWFLLAVAIFLLGALGDWPYAYYQLLRWVVCSVGTYSAYMAYTQERKGWTGVFVAVAILFNPIMPFYMERDTWQILDVAAVVPFLAFAFINKTTRQS